MCVDKYKYLVMLFLISIAISPMSFMETTQISAESRSNNFKITATTSSNVPIFVNASYRNQLLNLSNNIGYVARFQNVLLMYMVKNGNLTNNFLEIKGNSIQLTWNITTGPYFIYITNNGTYSFYTYSLQITSAYTTIFTTCYTNMSNTIWEGVNHTILTNPPLQSLYLRIYSLSWAGPYRFGSYSFFNYTIVINIWNPNDAFVQYKGIYSSCPFIIQPNFKNTSKMLYSITFGNFCGSQTNNSINIFSGSNNYYNFYGYIQLINYRAKYLPVGNYSFQFADLNPMFNYFLYNLSLNVVAVTNVSATFFPYYATIPTNWGQIYSTYTVATPLSTAIYTASFNNGMLGIESNNWVFANPSRWNTTSGIPDIPIGNSILKEQNNAGSSGIMYDSVQFQGKSFSDGAIEGWVYSSGTNLKMPSFWIRTAAQTSGQSCTFLGNPSSLCSGYVLRFYNDSVVIASSGSNGGKILQNYSLGQFIGNTWWHVKLQAIGLAINVWITTSKVFSNTPTMHVYDATYSSGYAAFSGQTKFISGSYYEYFDAINVSIYDTPNNSTTVTTPLPISGTGNCCPPPVYPSSELGTFIFIIIILAIIFIGIIVISKSRNSARRSNYYNTGNQLMRSTISNTISNVNTTGTQSSQSYYNTGSRKFCLSCGQPVELEDIFCANCGEKQQ